MANKSTFINDLTEGSVMKRLIRFTLPLMLANLLQVCYNLVDMFFVGQYAGTDALSAVSISSNVTMLMFFCFMGIATGGQIYVAQTVGAGRRDKLDRIVGNSLTLCVLVSLILMLTIPLATPILRLINTPEEILGVTRTYLIICTAGNVTVALYNALCGILRGMGDSRHPTMFVAISTAVNIVLDYLFVAVLHWGVAGAAIATVFSQAVSALLCLYYMFRKFDILKMEKGETALDKHYIKGLLDMGVPMGLQFSITAIGSIMLQSANNALGTSCVAAFTAGMRIKMFFMCPLESMGIAMATYCGQNYGAGKTERINMGLRASFFMVCLYCIFCFIVLHIFARHIIYLFVDFHEYEIIEKANQFIVTSCTYFIPLGLLCLLRYSIQGLGYSKLAMMSGVFEMVDRTAVSLFLVPILGYTGVCYGDPSAWFAADLFLIPAYLYVHKRLSRKRCYAQAS